MKRFLNGFFSYYRGIASSFTNLKTRKIIILTALANLILFIVMTAWWISKLGKFLHGHLINPHLWYQYVYYYFAYTFAFIALFFISAIIVYFAFTILMVGVGDILARASFNYLGAAQVRTKNSLLISIFKAVILALLGGAVFFISIIPGLGLVGLLLGALLVSFDMMDYGFDQTGLTLPQKLSFFRDNSLGVLGFAVGLAMVMAVPIINVLLLPSGIVAASGFYAQQLYKQRHVSERSHT